MTSAIEVDEFRAAKKQRSGNEAKPVSGITAENYVIHNAAFVRANGNVGFFIVRDAAWATSEFPHTPLAWRAWMAYFASKGIKALTIQKQGKGTVPSHWPHLFDADWPKAYDQALFDEAKAETP